MAAGIRLPEISRQLRDDLFNLPVEDLERIRKNFSQAT